MLRLIISCVVTAILTFALTVSLRSHNGPTVVAASPFTPPCPQAQYGADGNMSPLLCIVDNPLALQYFAQAAPHTFALGPNANPAEVADALNSDFKHGGTGPTLCSIYQLAAWRNQWRFGISPINEVGDELHMPSDWCPAPSFTDDLKQGHYLP